VPVEHQDRLLHVRKKVDDLNFRQGFFEIQTTEGDDDGLNPLVNAGTIAPITAPQL